MTEFLLKWYFRNSIAKSILLKQGLWLLYRKRHLLCHFIAKSILLKQGLWQTYEIFVVTFYTNCKEYSTKTRIVTNSFPTFQKSYSYCKEYSTKTRIVTFFTLKLLNNNYIIAKSILLKQGLWHIFHNITFLNFKYCKEYSTKTSIVTLGNWI